VVREAFGSDNESGSDNEEAKKKRKRIVSGGAASDASDTEENKKESKPEEGGAEEGAQPVLPDDSSDDEGVNPTDQGGVGQGEFVLDFDLMMEQKKAERRRRRKKDIDLINDNDDAIAKMIADMRLAAREDRDLNAARQPATKKNFHVGHGHGSTQQGRFANGLCGGQRPQRLDRLVGTYA